jgi:DNA-binding winged helix-turn-helix (wHTH) protein
MNDMPIQIGQLEIDLIRQRITRAGTLIHLTKTEWGLLKELAVNPNTVQHHERLLKKVWGEAYNDETEYVHTYMRRLRRKLEDDPAAPTLFITEAGIGYRFDLPIPKTPPRPTNSPLSKAARLINALPLDVGDRYIGRERAERDLQRLFDERARVIGVYGRVGVGKTALVSTMIRRWLASDPTIVGVVCFNPVNTPITLQRMLSDIGALSNVQIDDAFSDSESPSQRAAALLSRLDATPRAPILICFDGIESLQDPIRGALLDDDVRAFIEAILMQGGGVRLVMTSREPLILARDLQVLTRTIALTNGLSTDESVNLLRRLDPDNAARLRDAHVDTLRALAARADGKPSWLYRIAGLLAADPLLAPARLAADEALFAQQIAFAALEHDFARLDADARAVLIAASGFERLFTSDALQSVIDVQGSDILPRLVRAGYLRHDRQSATFALPTWDRAYWRSVIPPRD